MFIKWQGTILFTLALLQIVYILHDFHTSQAHLCCNIFVSSNFQALHVFPRTVKFKEAMKMDCALCYDVLHGTEFRSCPNRASKDPICNVPYTLNILIPTPLILFCLKFLLAKKGQGPTTVKSHLSCGIMGALS